MNRIRTRAEQLSWERFNKHLAQVMSATRYDVQESEDDREQRRAKARKDYKYFVRHYFPHYATADCAWFHVRAAKLILKYKLLRIILAWFRGAAKSVHADIMIPMWLKMQVPRQFNTMVLVNKSYDGAKQLLSDLQAELQGNHRYINDYGEQLKMGSWEEGEFSTKDGTAFFAMGLKQSPRGLRERQYRPDLIILDDIDDDMTVRNEALVDDRVQWILRSLIPAMDIGRGRVIVANNIIHDHSIISKLLRKYEEILKTRRSKGQGVDDPEDTHYHISRVNIRDEEGHLTWPEKMTDREVDNLEQELGYSVAQTELYNNPILEGKIFQREWFTFQRVPFLHQFSDLVAYYDGGYKNTGTSDSKSLCLVGLRDGKYYLVKTYTGRASRMQAVDWHYDLHGWLQAKGVTARWYMEEVFMLDILYDDFEAASKERGFFIPVMGDKRKKPDKDLRIQATAGAFERGAVWLNQAEENNHHMKALVEQYLAFQPGKKTLKDGPDAVEGAMFLLQERARTDEPAVVGMRGSSGNNRYRY